MDKQIRYLKCSNCGYEDSSILTMSLPIGSGILKCYNCKEEVKFDEYYCEQGRGMTFKEYAELLKFIVDNHGWRNLLKEDSKGIKYVRNSFDTRTNLIFSIQLDNEDFTIVNQNRHRNLKEWIYGYLKS